ncbi:MAG: helix-turn-helix transcriptional regulator [Bacillota bacterium]
MTTKREYPRIGGNKRGSKSGTLIVEQLEKLGVHISRNTLSNYEVGNTDTPASIMAYLSKIYRCDIEDLYEWKYLANIKGRYSPQKTYYISNNTLKPKETDVVDYSPTQNMSGKTDDFSYYILDDENPYLHLPRLTRLVVKSVEGLKTKIHDEYDYFLVNMDVKKKYEYDGMKNTTFLTKAKRVEESQKPRLVHYIDHVGQQQFMSEQRFTNSIVGLVTKIIIDIDTYNVRKNQIR